MERVSLNKALCIGIPLVPHLHFKTRETRHKFPHNCLVSRYLLYLCFSEDGTVEIAEHMHTGGRVMDREQV